MDFDSSCIVASVRASITQCYLGGYAGEKDSMQEQGDKDAGKRTLWIPFELTSKWLSLKLAIYHLFSLSSGRQKHLYHTNVSS